MLKLVLFTFLVFLFSKFLSKLTKWLCENYNTIKRERIYYKHNTFYTNTWLKHLYFGGEGGNLSKDRIAMTPNVKDSIKYNKLHTFNPYMKYLWRWQKISSKNKRHFVLFINLMHNRTRVMTCDDKENTQNQTSKGKKNQDHNK